MPVTITFHKISEKKPKHMEDIIWLRNTSSFGNSGFEPREIQAEYQWTSLDENGWEDGLSFTYEEGDDEILFEEHENMRLDILFDGYIVKDDTLWISQDDFWKCFEGTV